MQHVPRLYNKKGKMSVIREFKVTSRLAVYRNLFPLGDKSVKSALFVGRYRGNGLLQSVPYQRLVTT
jgi:hypothetical protein